MTPLKIHKRAAYAALILLAISLIFIWSIDVSLAESGSGIKIVDWGMLTNGFWDFNPLQTYHLALYGLAISVGLLGFITIMVCLRLSTYDGFYIRHFTPDSQLAQLVKIRELTGGKK